MAQESKSCSDNNADVIERLKKQVQDTYDETAKSQQEFAKMEQELEDDYIKRLKLSGHLTKPTQEQTFRKLCEVHKWLLYNNIHMCGADATNTVWWCQVGDIPFVTNPKKGEDQTPEYKEIKSFIEEMKSQWLEEYFHDWWHSSDLREEYQKLTDLHK